MGLPFFAIFELSESAKISKNLKNGKIGLFFEFMINWQILVLKNPMKMLKKKKKKKKKKKNSEKMAFFQIGLPFFAIFELSESAKISKNLKKGKIGLKKKKKKKKKKK